MNEGRFWQLIDETRAEADGDLERHAELLEDRLADEEPAAVAEFDRLFRQKRADAYRWDVWAAAYVINGGCSDDCFEYFRNYVISLGRERFEATLRDPDSLAEIEIAEDPEAESLGYAALAAYERAAGDEMPLSDPFTPDQPAGNAWDEDDVASVVPRLAEKYDW